MDISSEMIHALLPIYMVTVLGTSTLAVGIIEGMAVGLLEQSAAHGFAPADLRLGELYLSGVAMAPDLDKAQHYLQRAAANGSPKALRLLGQMYALGIAPKAYAYFSAAADRGDLIAKAERERLAAALTPEQIAAATASAKTLAPPITR
jgi:hypothetical protein